MAACCPLSNTRTRDPRLDFGGVKALTLALLGLALLAGRAAGGEAKPWLWQCEQIGLETAKDTCYERLLLEDINRSGDPARELPRIDQRAKTAGTSLYGRCHMLMHVVGRRWAVEHKLTLDGLQAVVPRSNDPGCSAGFGMGLVMALGPAIISTGGRSAVSACERLPTRLRKFTCVHSLGHALMRGYHETLPLAVRACTRLGSARAADCAQGAFHDYWIALRGADETQSPVHAVRSPRRLCAQYARYALACWYRYWIEQAPGPVLRNAHDLERVCSGLRGAQRAGCIAGASKDVYESVQGQARLCAGLSSAADAAACMRGVANQALAGKRTLEVALFRSCARLPRGAQGACAAWLGKTFNVLENGRFRRSGCPRVVASMRQACDAGARRWTAPLVTFA
jgi:hypothetical protein